MEGTGLPPSPSPSSPPQSLNFEPNILKSSLFHCAVQDMQKATKLSGQSCSALNALMFGTQLRGSFVRVVWAKCKGLIDPGTSMLGTFDRDRENAMSQ